MVIGRAKIQKNNGFLVIYWHYSVVTHHVQYLAIFILLILFFVSFIKIRLLYSFKNYISVVYFGG